MNEVVMNRFQETTLLECNICEYVASMALYLNADHVYSVSRRRISPNPSYKGFNDNEEDINEQIQVHFEEKHPDESYALKRCSNVHLKVLRSLR